MQESQNRSPLQRFEQYRASKTVLFWACAGSAIAATIVGFSWGGWVTGGTAQTMADKAGAQVRQSVAARVCVDRFMAAPDAAAQLAALQKMTSSYTQRQFVQDGGWAIIPVSAAASSTAANTTDDRKAAELCAEELAARASPVAGESARAEDAAAGAR
ncbi:MAG TPA: hypothetical protein VFV80_02825 [Geminicoccaceae bacterium]|nr:hypothetical protein [Geminicoccaceae bacterium]